MENNLNKKMCHDEGEMVALLVFILQPMSTVL